MFSLIRNGQSLFRMASPIWIFISSEWGLLLFYTLVSIWCWILVILIVQFSSVQFSHSVMSNSLQPHELQHARPSCASPTPRVQQTHVHWVGDTTQTSHPLSSPSPPALNVSQHQGLFQWVSSLHEVARVLEFQLQDQSFNEHPSLIFLRMDWLDLLAVQGTLKSLLQHHSSKASIFQCSDCFIVQISHPYMTTGKNMALTRRNFVGKVMSLLF